jgi:hypothetical protein
MLAHIKTRHKGIPHVRRVGLERSTAQSRVGAVLTQLPRTDPSLQDLVGIRGRIDEVGDPGVPVCISFKVCEGVRRLCIEKKSLPAGLNVGCVVFGLLVVDPSCSD